LALAGAGIGWEEGLRMSVPERNSVVAILSEEMQKMASGMTGGMPGRPAALPAGVHGTARWRGGK